MKTKALILLTILSLSLIPFVKASSDNWANSSFHYRNVYTINSTLIDEQLYDFPVLVYLNSSYIQWDRVNDNLSDLRFYNISNNLLSHELQEDYIVNNEAWLWVKIPYISNVSDTYFYMYYGCSYAESVENKTDVWNNSYVMVQHMNDATTSTILDSTSNDNDGTKTGVNEPNEVDGKIGKAQHSDGINDYVDCGEFNITGSEITLSCWVNPNDVSGSQSLIGKLYDWEIYLYNQRVAVRINTHLVSSPNSLINSGIQNKIDITYDGSYIVIYVNGELDISTDAVYGVLDNHAGRTIRIGIRNDVTYSYPLEGIIDEPQIIGDAVSSTWVGASYEVQRLNLISLTNTETFNEDYMAFGVISIMISMFSFVMVITMIKRKGEK